MSLVNIYVGLDDVKNAVEITGTSYDATILKMAQKASRLIDDAMGYVFFPKVATLHFDGSGCQELWLRPNPLLEVSSIVMSADLGYTYSDTLTAGDYYVSDGATYDETPIRLLVMNPSGNYYSFWTGRRAVRIAGIWGWRRNYADAFEDSLDALAADITSSATVATVSNADGLDLLGQPSRFQIGQMLKIGTEYLFVSGVNTVTDTLTLVRGVNGSTAAAHASGDTIYIWRPEEVVQQATLMQTVRWFKRGQQAYQDVSASLELGRLLFAAQIDPEIQFILMQARIRDIAI